ncbi:uncharacterized protein LOC125740622 isoform X6 [Brienomyrus brachyistius]|uniref:uncharacterized protein LOC125740622 isoform X4 n=1 Tax=Brienomyrus brachyistius TaxID=42636 RepID=UPI0020B39357|nr:uncharacterized protein LOC125740622 isoform X4 [Brienomyrus brachyistius]XP_048868019.1 uncharacterized protein LOC125740622 isoform X5 [Brienomyrus brachyistius]XP_048868020.1 uncharacterized protein LOC125740622 isoform X6 [Brienomyrus brachyistius]
MAALKCLGLPLVICALGMYVQLNTAELTEMSLVPEPGISTWTNCGSSDILNITSFSIPNQITIPGSINVSFLGELKVPVSAPLKVALHLPPTVWNISDVELPSFLANGEYEAQITVSSGTQEIACLRTSFHLKLQ